MKKAIKILTLALLAGFFSCNPMYDEHYKQAPETVDMTLWEVISGNPDFSVFMAHLEETGLDSLFNQKSSYTLFIPNNKAFASYIPDSVDMVALLQFHILNYSYNVVNVEKSLLKQTSAGKFAQLEYYNGLYTYNGASIIESSPLYLDGRIYELENIAYPKQNLYEYIAQNASVLRTYIDDFDSILMDLEKSTPIGFDEDGNTIYDSVYALVNYFDTLYFPVNEEHRSRTATFILFDDDQYVNALDEMALNLGGALTGAEDIPVVWQEDVLMPELIKTGLFPNSLYYEDFMSGAIRNIEGDTVQVDYTKLDPDSRNLCSNGITFDYAQFSVPDYLYLGEVTIEGEHMVDSVAAGVFFWKPEYTITGSQDAVAAAPLKMRSTGARNDSLVSVTFPGQNYSGEYVFEFKFPNMFPQEYQFIWAANYRPSGYYEIYANDVLIRSFDTFDMRSAVLSVITGEYYFPVNGHSMFDARIDHLTEYGDVKITIKYVYPGRYGTNGFNIDFISLIPIAGM